MIIHDRPLSWYISRLRDLRHFSMGMFGDGEWDAIRGGRIGERNCHGTVFTHDLKNGLRSVLNYRHPDYLFSAPEIIRNVGIVGPKFLSTIQRRAKHIEFVEKDMWDVACREGRLTPFIRQLREMKVTIISNENLRRLDELLRYDSFIEIGYPEIFDDIPSIVMETLKLYEPNRVYLVSAGMPAAIITMEIHRHHRDVFALDLGSIWDAFVGIGDERGWRRELYADEQRYQDWLNHYYEELNE